MSRVTKIVVALMIASSATLMSGCGQICIPNGMGEPVCDPL